MTQLHFTKKPITIEAFQMTQRRRRYKADWPEWLKAAIEKKPQQLGSLHPIPKSLAQKLDDPNMLQIKTLEGVQLVSWDDYIIQGIQGEIYPCKPDIFEESYEAATQEGLIMNLNFGQALDALRAGERVARFGWNGKDMFIFLPEGRVIKNDKARSFAHFDDDTVKICSHIDMKAADGSFVTGWLASQTDMLADDWLIVGDA